MFDSSLSLKDQYVDLYFSRWKFLSYSNNFHVLRLMLELDEFFLVRLWCEWFSPLKKFLIYFSQIFKEKIGVNGEKTLSVEIVEQKNHRKRLTNQNIVRVSVFSKTFSFGYV